MSKAILINPEHRTIEVVDFDDKDGMDGMLSVRKHLHCTDFESAPSLFPDTTTLVVDLYSEELSGKDHHKGMFAVPDKIIGHVTGRMLIIGVDGEEAIDMDVTTEQVQELIQWKPIPLLIGDSW